MNSNSKYLSMDFSTNELDGYTSRHHRTRKVSYHHDLLPHKMEKAAITIQKFWRARMAMRRLFYQHLLQQLIYDNEITQLKNKKQKQYLKAIENHNSFHEKLNSLKVQRKMGKTAQQMKELVRKCVGITFKLEKKMLTNWEIKKLTQEKQQVKYKILKLKDQKQELRNFLTQESPEEEQVLLREIRQANATLLKITTEKNHLRQQLTEKSLQRQ